MRLLRNTPFQFPQLTLTLFTGNKIRWREQKEGSGKFYESLRRGERKKETLQEAWCVTLSWRFLSLEKKSRRRRREQKVEEQSLTVHSQEGIWEEFVSSISPLTFVSLMSSFPGTLIHDKRRRKSRLFYDNRDEKHKESIFLLLPFGLFLFFSVSLHFSPLTSLSSLFPRFSPLLFPRFFLRSFSFLLLLFPGNIFLTSLVCHSMNSFCSLQFMIH